MLSSIPNRSQVQAVRAVIPVSALPTAPQPKVPGVQLRAKSCRITRGDSIGGVGTSEGSRPGRCLAAPGLIARALPNVTRRELRKLAILRLREGRCLFQAGHFDGAYYLTGYSVECALKACIARKTRRYDFPDKRVAIDSWSHDLAKLLKTAGLETTFDQDAKDNEALAENWTIVKDWSEDKRYKLTRTRQAALDLYEAVMTDDSGVLKWIRRYW